jgi:glycosyltransferase involved in cell wall biosynthesis
MNTVGKLQSVIVICDHAFVNGGQAKVAIDTALAMRARGLNVTVFCGVGPVDQRLIDAGVDCVCLGQQDLLGDPNRGRSAMRGLWNREAAASLGALLKNSDPETTIAHVHGWAKSLSPSIGPAIVAGPVPHVYTLHEYFLACPNGGFYDHHEQAICTRRPLGISCLAANCDPRNRAHKAWRVARQAVLWSAGRMPRALRDVIYLTRTQIDAMRRNLPGDVRLHHLPNPIARSEAPRVEAEKNDVFLFIGRLSAEKGAELAAKAAKQAGIRIAFAGEGECREKVAAANPDALMLGWLKPDQLEAWISKARCLVFSSLWYEGLPMSVIEAMQRGLPVLVSDKCAAAELVRHETDGLHVPIGDELSWTAAMRLMASPDRVARYSKSCHIVSRGFLDPQSYCSRLLEIYGEAAAAQAAERSLAYVGQPA